MTIIPEGSEQMVPLTTEDHLNMCIDRVHFLKTLLGNANLKSREYAHVMKWWMDAMRELHVVYDNFIAERNLREIENDMD